MIIKNVENYEKLYEVKIPIDNYRESNPSLISGDSYIPCEWDKIKKYANDRYSSEKYYFNFLIKNRIF